MPQVLMTNPANDHPCEGTPYNGLHYLKPLLSVNSEQIVKNGEKIQCFFCRPLLSSGSNKSHLICGAHLQTDSLNAETQTRGEPRSSQALVISAGFPRILGTPHKIKKLRRTNFCELLERMPCDEVLSIFCSDFVGSARGRDLGFRQPISRR